MGMGTICRYISPVTSPEEGTVGADKLYFNAYRQRNNRVLDASHMHGTEIKGIILWYSTRRVKDLHDTTQMLKSGRNVGKNGVIEGTNL